jgi:protein Tex
MTSRPPTDVSLAVAQELGLPPRGVAQAIALFSQGNTIPFVARYRKEATGDLDEVALRRITEHHTALVEFGKRRSAILLSIDEQGKLTDALRQKIGRCRTRVELEDLYLPYKKKRKTRATQARERGLEGLAKRILEQPGSGSPTQDAASFVSAERGVPDVAAALAGARDVVAERIAEDAEVRRWTREAFQRGVLTSTAIKSKTTQPTKFEQYYRFKELLARVPSHRFLAIERGVAAGVLRSKIEVEEPALRRRIAQRFGLRGSSPFAGELQEAIADSLKRLLAPSLGRRVRGDQKAQADRDSIQVFADNLRNLLLAGPFGAKSLIGIDPGLRTGCKCVSVASTGKFLETLTIYPLRDKARAATELLAFVQRHAPVALAIGNGTGGRETEALARQVLKDANLKDLLVISVNEAGASVYSASDVAREEFPNLDLTIRGAISIARRLQDPLAELVKIDPKSIGVGQYQHDVDQALLQTKLQEVVESCVNAVGVQLNTASAALLTHVAGVGPKLAQRIVAHRETQGPFADRQQLKTVKGFGAKTFEQAAGFIRVRGGREALDESAVHPERYRLVQRMAKDLGLGVGDLVGNGANVSRIQIADYVDESVGEPTLRDILSELEKPGRDPRKRFEPPRFRDDLNSIEDLSPGLVLEGVVTNVTAFGAFVDLGVHQDGLVHISQLADRYVSDPHEVVKVGDRIQVRVLDVDLKRRRIALSARKQRPE